jgi:hypothetical protein
MLAVGGTMSNDRGGPTFPAKLAADYGFKSTATCRSVYLPAFRNALPELFEAFDFADPSTVTGRRNSSTVAPQALFMLNNPFVIEQANAAAKRLLAENHATDDERITRAYRLALGRSPSEGERRAAAKFLSTNVATRSTAWAAIFQALFASADFRHVE